MLIAIRPRIDEWILTFVDKIKEINTPLVLVNVLKLASEGRIAAFHGLLDRLKDLLPDIFDNLSDCELLLKKLSEDEVSHFMGKRYIDSQDLARRFFGLPDLVRSLYQQGERRSTMHDLYVESEYIRWLNNQPPEKADFYRALLRFANANELTLQQWCKLLAIYPQSEYRPVASLLVEKLEGGAFTLKEELIALLKSIDVEYSNILYPYLDNIDFRLEENDETIEILKALKPSNRKSFVERYFGEVLAEVTDAEFFAQLVLLVGIDGVRLPDKFEQQEKRKLLVQIPKYSDSIECLDSYRRAVDIVRLVLMENCVEDDKVNKVIGYLQHHISNGDLSDKFVLTLLSQLNNDDLSLDQESCFTLLNALPKSMFVDAVKALHKTYVIRADGVAEVHQRDALFTDPQFLIKLLNYVRDEVDGNEALFKLSHFLMISNHFSHKELVFTHLSPYQQQRLLLSIGLTQYRKASFLSFFPQELRPYFARVLYQTTVPGIELSQDYEALIYLLVNMNYVVVLSRNLSLIEAVKFVHEFGHAKGYFAINW